MTDKRILLGSIGVDSGQMMLCDPCYISSWGGDEFDPDRHELMQKNNEYEFSYAGACATTLKRTPDGYSQGGVLQNFIGANLAAVCSSGFGDGVYEVWITVSDEGDWGQRVSKMEIIFIHEEELK